MRFTYVDAGTTSADFSRDCIIFPIGPPPGHDPSLFESLVWGLHDMHEHHDLAADAAVLLHERVEQLTSLLSELESLRARVLAAERTTAAETNSVRVRAPSRHTPSSISPAATSAWSCAISR